MARNGRERLGCVAAQVLVAADHHFADHAGQAHFLAVLGAVNTAHAIVVQRPNFRRNYHSAAATKNLDVRATPAFEQINHVFEILHMPALVRADGNALHVLLQGGGYHLFDAAVVAQMNHLRAHALQDAAHDVDGCIVAVKQTGRGNKTHFVGRPVLGEGFKFCGEVGHGTKPWKRIARGD